MKRNQPSFTIGIEEEYLLVDRQTRALAGNPPQALLSACEKELGKQVSPEFLKCQIEVGTEVCRTVGDARGQLLRLRGTVARIAGEFGISPIAASTHPFAEWTKQQNTDRDRYNALAEDLQDVVRRMIICGMHVHVGIDDDDLRIDLLNQASYFLPHLLALSTSSPFWQGRVTGLKSYRLAVFDEMPRTGMPPAFSSFGEYERTVGVLVRAGLIEDATKVWWDLRPSHRFPTLEMRITDVCTTLEDALTIAALYQCLMRMLWRLRGSNQRWRQYLNFLIDENRWRAQRYGRDGKLVDFGKGELVPLSDLVEELIALVNEDAVELDCVAEIAHARVIIKRGTSADRQLAVYKASRAAGASERESLETVVDWLAAEMISGTGEAAAPPVAKIGSCKD